MPLPVAADDDHTAPRVDAVRLVGRDAAVTLPDGGVTVIAKVDTGADTSSIDARNVEPFERDGEDWVRFEIIAGEGRRVAMERPVAREVTIVQASGGREERYVVEMAFCVEGLMMPAEVNLSDRGELDYRMLLGRSFLVRGGFLVNPARADVGEPTCEGAVER